MKPIYIIIMAICISILSGCMAQRIETKEVIKEEIGKPPTAEVEQIKPPRAGNVIKVGVSMQGLEAPYVAAVQQHLENSVKNSEVEAVFLDAQSNVEKQISQIEQFIAWKVDVIILNPISYTGCAPAVDAANKAGIPIVALITRVANQDKANSFVGSDHKDSGIIEAEMVAKEIGGKGNIVVIEGVMGIDAQIQRMEGYKEVLAKYPDIKIVAQQAANWQRSEAFAITENWIKSGKKFDVVLSQNDNMALGALRAVEQANLVSKIKVFGIDGDKDALEAVKAGRLAGTVFQDAKRQAERAVECAIKLTKGEPIEKYYVIPFKAVTEENADKFLIQ
jgi:inositol transport system substrate-binding protein